MLECPKMSHFVPSGKDVLHSVTFLFVLECPQMAENGRLKNDVMMDATFSTADQPVAVLNPRFLFRLRHSIPNFAPVPGDFIHRLFWVCILRP